MRVIFKIVHKCSSCKKDYKLGDFKRGCSILKTCINCRVCHNLSKKRNMCIHNKEKCSCRICGGSVFCPHDIQKSKCKKCSDPVKITILNMIKNSKRSDKVKNRFDELNYIDYSFVKNLVDNCNNQCYYCSCELQYINYANNLATIERLDNDIGHIKSNCVIACRYCNTIQIGQR